MRDADIHTTMNIHGGVVTDVMGQAHCKVVKMGPEVDRQQWRTPAFGAFVLGVVLALGHDNLLRLPFRFLG